MLKNGSRWRAARQSAIALVVVALVWWPGFTYFGYCHVQGRFLSDRDKVDAAIRSTIASYPPVLASHGNYPPKDPIRYASVEEFRRINPDCCRLSTRAPNAPNVSFLSRVQGKNSTYVHVDYLVRYRDERGNGVSEPAATFAAISNCGHSWNGY